MLYLATGDSPFGAYTSIVPWRLPFGIRTEKEVTYEISTERYSDTEAMDIAYYQLSRELERELSEAQILKKTITSELTEEAYILNCTVRCIENIGQTAEFDAEKKERLYGAEKGEDRRSRKNCGGFRKLR